MKRRKLRNARRRQWHRYLRYLDDLRLKHHANIVTPPAWGIRGDRFIR